NRVYETKGNGITGDGIITGKENTSGYGTFSMQLINIFCRMCRYSSSLKKSMERDMAGGIQ
ncbi:MAG: hypothetical protein AB1798_23855, partial [Spirochaetota bacterium]